MARHHRREPFPVEAATQSAIVSPLPRPTRRAAPRRRRVALPPATASSAVARATSADGARRDRLSRDKAACSSSRNARSGSFGRRDIGHLATPQPPSMADPVANDPLVPKFPFAEYMKLACCLGLADFSGCKMCPYSGLAARL
jgi:hypothetical protein